MERKGQEVKKIENTADIRSFVSTAKSKSQQSEKKIAEIARTVDAARLLVAVFANIAVAPIEHIDESTYGNVTSKLELLAYHIYPFFGFSNEPDVTPWHTNECIAALDELYISRLQCSAFSEIDQDSSDPAKSLARSVRTYTEIVRGSAYPEQTTQEILSIQGPFEAWFRKRIGIGPRRSQELLWAITKTHEEKYNSFIKEARDCGNELGKLWEKAKNKRSRSRTKEEKRIINICKNRKIAEIFGIVSRLNEISPDLLPVSREDLASLESPPTEEEWEAFVGLIGLTKENRKNIVDPIGVRLRPLFILPDGRVLVSGISNTLDALWGKFEEIARANQVYYDVKYQVRKSRWLEESVYNSLGRIFLPQYIYRNLSYSDPDKGDGSTAELDIAITLGPFLVLVEAKAKQFKMESQLGDPVRLRSDIKANVEDAFEQARRAVRYINSTDSPQFKEISSGRVLAIQKERLYRTHLLTVSQHHLSGMATRLAVFEDLGLFRDQDYPFSICASDLDLISRFCDGPDVFLHYIEKRLELQRGPVYIVGDEIEFFGAYLETRLQAKILWEQNGKPVDSVWLDGFQLQFDRWMYHKRGQLDKPPIIKLQVPEEIEKILQELRNRSDDDSARWIAFSILGMTDPSLKELDRRIREVRETKLTPGMFRRYSFHEDDVVISIVASLDLSREMLRESTRFRTQIEKYRRKASRSIGIGIMVRDNSRPFDCAVWIEGPWEHDRELEKALEHEPPFVPAPGQKLPGRNEPCVCGSGKKFKKCCLPKIEYAQRKRFK